MNCSLCYTLYNLYEKSFNLFISFTVWCRNFLQLHWLQKEFEITIIYVQMLLNKYSHCYPWRHIDISYAYGDICFVLVASDSCSLRNVRCQLGQSIYQNAKIKIKDKIIFFAIFYECVVCAIAKGLLLTESICNRSSACFWYNLYLHWSSNSFWINLSIVFRISDHQGIVAAFQRMTP